MAERVCPKCGRRQPDTSELKQCVYCSAEITEPEASPQPGVEALVAAEPGDEAPAGSVPPEPIEQPVPEGKRKCPECGELLYETERRCWRCGHEMVPGDVPVAAMPPAATPEPPPVQPPVVAPGALPPVTPPVTPAVTPPAAPAPPPYYPAGAPPATPAPDAGAQNLGIWSLVLGLLGFLGCCPVIASIIAIILGVKAKKQGVSGLGSAGILLGIVGLIGWVIVGILFGIGVLAEAADAATSAAPGWLWGASCMLG